MVVIFLAVMFLAGAVQAKPAAPYIFGYQTDLSGVARASYAPIAEGFRLYVEGLNARGGVNGHPIKVIYEDDKSKPGLAGGVAEKLITKDKVLAILGLGFSRSQPPVMELARKSGVGVITGYTATSPLFPPNPAKNVFSVGVQMHPRVVTLGYSNGFVASRIHPGGKVAVSAFDTPGGRHGTDWGVAWSKKQGMKVVYRFDLPPTSQDFTPWLAKIAKVKPDIIIVTVGGSIYIPFLRQMEKYGLEKLDILVVDFVSEGDLVKGIKQLSVGNGENVLWLSRYSSALDPRRPAEFDNIEKAMKKFGHKYTLSGLHAMGWTMGRTVEEALKNAGWPCARAAFISALEKTEVDTRGLTGGPIKFSPKDHYGRSWWKAYRWDAKLKGLKTVVDWFDYELSEIMIDIKK